jgi:hypothetical protein
MGGSGERQMRGTSGAAEKRATGEMVERNETERAEYTPTIHNIHGTHLFSQPVHLASKHLNRRRDSRMSSLSRLEVGLSDIRPSVVVSLPASPGVSRAWGT